MPKELTHWILAGRTLSALGNGSALGTVIRNNQDLFLAGAVLPDTLLHLFSGPFALQALAVARRFHDAPGNSYAPLIQAEELLSGTIPADLLSCLLGVLCHMQADIVFHPFVYAAAGLTDSGDHYRIETAIDVHFLNKGAEPPASRMVQLVSPRTKDTLLRACSLLFDPDATLPDLALIQALDRHCRFQAMYGSTFWKLAAKILAGLGVARVRQQQHLFYPLLRSNRDDLSGYESTWLHPATGEPGNKLLNDLGAEVLRRMLVLLRRIEEVGSLKSALTEPPGENLLSGLFSVMHADMKNQG